MARSMVSFTLEELKEFKKLYDSTKKGDVFKFKGRNFLHDFAKYVIEYMEIKFKVKL